MKAQTLWRLRQGAVVFGLAAVLSVPFTGTASPATDTATCMVVLECPNGQKLTAIPDASGRFVFANVPSGTCRLKVVPSDAKDVSAPAAGESRLLPTVNKVADEATPAAKSEVAAGRDSASGMATGKRQHKPMVFKITLDEFPAAAKTMAMDDWHKAPVSIVVDAARKTRELTGHVTLIK